MAFQSIVPALIMTLTTILALLVIVHTWQRRSNPGGINFILLMVAVAVDTSASLFLLILSPWPGLDLIPFAFALTGLVIVWGVFRHHKIHPVPIAHAFNKTQLYEFESRRTNQLPAFQPFSQLVVPSLELSQIFKTVVNVLHETFAYPYVSIYHLDGELLRLGAQIGYPEGFVHGEISIDQGISGRTVRSHCPQFVKDVTTDPDYLCASKNVTSEICVPLIKDQALLGTLNIESTSEIYLEEYDLNLLIFLADQVSTAMENARLYQAEREQRELAEVLSRIGITLSENLNLETIMGRLLDEIKQVVPYDRACVMLMDEKRKYARISRLRGYEAINGDTTAQTIPLEFEIASTARLRRMAETGNPAIIADTKTDPGWAISNALTHFRSWVGAPIMIQGKVIGFLSLEKIEPMFYQAVHAGKLAALAGQAAIVMVNANIFTEMEKRAKKERLLFAATRDFTAGLDTSAVLHAIVHHMVVALEVDGCTVSRWDPENDCVVTLIDHNTDNEVHCTFPGDTYALSEYPATRFVLKSGNPLMVNIDDPLIDPAEKSFLERYGNESLLMLPLRVGRGKPTFGIIELFRKPGASPFLENDLELAQSLSSQAAIAMENALLYEETQRMAIEDELTHLYNRRGFFELGRRELERAERFGHPMSVLFLDIDFFKQFNDLHSYAVGDQVLRLLANCLHANLREVDVVGRYGGEEFAILLPESDVQAAITVAERIRGAVEAIRVKTDQGEVGFTISIGICQRTPEMPDLDSIIEAAGIALHGAKKTGRNRVEIYLSGDQENSLTQGFGALIHIHSHQKDNTYVSFPPKNT